MNEQQRERATKIRVGIFVLVSLGVFLAVVYMLGARARLFEARYIIHAEFTEVAGLQEGATVRLAGVQIGRVARVELPAQPGDAPFVRIGDVVSEGQTLLIIEAMKVMNQIRAPRAGRLAKVLVGDAEPVEYGAALMMIE